MSKKSKGTMPVGAEPSKDHSMDEYEIKNHMDTLIKAHEIASDPEKMAKVHKLAGRHKKAITSIKQLKDKYADMVKPKDGMSDNDADD